MNDKKEMFEKMLHLIGIFQEINKRSNIKIDLMDDNYEHISFNLEGKTKNNTILIESFRFNYDFDSNAARALINNFIKKLDLIIEFEKQG